MYEGIERMNTGLRELHAEAEPAANHDKPFFVTDLCVHVKKERRITVII